MNIMLENRKEIAISFDYDPDLVAQVKELPRRRYDPDSKRWLVPISAVLLEELCDAFPEAYVAQEVHDVYAAQKESFTLRYAAVDISLAEDNYAAISFDYDPDLIRAARSLSNRVYDPDSKLWLVPISTVSLEELCDAFPEALVSKSVYDAYAAQKESFTLRYAAVDIFLAEDNCAAISFDYDPDLIRAARSLSNRVYDPDSKLWLVPISTVSLEEFCDAFPEALVSKSVHDAYAAQQDDQKLSLAADADLEVPGLRGELLPFQRAGVQYIDAKDGKVLIADEMGLGKTVQAIAWLQLRQDLRPALVICPASLKLNWARELNKWLPSSPENEVFVVKSGKAKKLPSAGIIVINYDLLGKYDLSGYKCVVMDESHSIKNSKAARTKQAIKVAKQAESILLLTGTPILNRPIDLWTQLHLLRPNVFANYRSYGRRYCDGQDRYVGKGRTIFDVSGHSHLDELNALLRRECMVRRKKEDVMADLPPKRRVQVPIRLSNESEYLDANRDFWDWLTDKVASGKLSRKKRDKALTAEALVKMNYLRQLAAQGKLDDTIDYVKNFLESGEKLVVFAHHKEVLDALIEAFSGDVLGDGYAVSLRGSDDMADRQSAVDNFQGDPRCKLFIGSTQAAGVGLTLTAASNIVFLEFPWRPADLSQAEDRCHRIGQAGSVTSYLLSAAVTGADTIDDVMLSIIEDKQAIADSALDGVGEGASDHNLIDTVIKIGEVVLSNKEAG